MNHTMKLWERVFEERLRREVMINGQQCGFMLRSALQIQ